VSELLAEDSIVRKSITKAAARRYLRAGKWAWRRMPGGIVASAGGQAFGRHLHRVVQWAEPRNQLFGTFFLRNRPELELLGRLLRGMDRGSVLHIAVLGCSKGAEVYSISYSLRSAHPNLRFALHALDISADVLRVAQEGVYSTEGTREGNGVSESSSGNGAELRRWMWDGQSRSIFERLAPGEMEAMFEVKGSQARVKPQWREGITWHLGDAGSPEMMKELGAQDVVIANRFLCHMEPPMAEQCLRNFARLVRPGGYLFVSGVDLDVRTKVARDSGWEPVTELLEEIHEGDASLRRDWPVYYWGLEPLDRRRKAWQQRYASVFYMPGEQSSSEPAAKQREPKV
jgi:chemotaxis methyl-accepting protein methylase